jgi:hypothetical protein
MALKGDRLVIQEDISFFCNSVSTRGGIASIVTAGSGAALDQANAAVAYANNSSGSYPIGMLMNDFVNYDLTKQHINFHKDETQIGGKANLMRKGWAVTSNYSGSPTGGAKAYLGSSGVATPTQASALINPPVGQFLSSPDEDGYVKLEVNLPQ